MHAAKRVQVGFGERVNLLLGDGPHNPLWTSFEALGLHVAFYLDNVPLNWCGGVLHVSSLLASDTCTHCQAWTRL